ncbi:hypothetical protein [Xanthobacter agilis]|uniref:Uncharacterized protein n=1 Tax=Xanthobacter agilis TaxID=47492 RepID=A0ABU0LJL7_XANAG|nr:hypothetical protein [Xanthobacter agilis]MDQ0507331.1 hypothetical protein [Xanthobacter agilis]
MDPSRSITSAEGVGTLIGAVRVDSGGADVIEINLNGKIIMYGRWKAIVRNNGTFSIDIISFGYDNKFNVDNYHIDARFVISRSDEDAIRKIISKLFKAAYEREKIFPFNLDDIKFDGDIRYSSGWIRTI